MVRRMGIVANSSVPSPRGPASTDSAGLVVIERLSGALSTQKLEALSAKLSERSAPNLAIRLLVDLSDAVPTGFGWDGLLEFAAHVDRIGLHARIPRVAIVASRDDVVALARLYKSLIQHDTGLAVFREAGAALEWLRANEATAGSVEYQVAPTAVRRLPQR